MAWISPRPLAAPLKPRKGMVEGPLPPSSAHTRLTERVRSQRTAMATRSENTFILVW